MLFLSVGTAWLSGPPLQISSGKGQHLCFDCSAFLPSGTHRPILWGSLGRVHFHPKVSQFSLLGPSSTEVTCIAEPLGYHHSSEPLESP